MMKLRKKEKIIQPIKNLFALMVVLCLGRITNAQSSVNSNADSLIRYFFVQKNILVNPIYEVKQKKRKIVSVTSNFYRDQKILSVNSNDTLLLVIFGTNQDHIKDYMLVCHTNKTVPGYLILGYNLLEEDLLLLKDYFSKEGARIPINIKRKILKEFSQLR